MVSFFSELSPETKELLEELKQKKNTIDPKKRVCMKSDGTIFNFNTFIGSLELVQTFIIRERLHQEKQKMNNMKC